MHDVLTDLLKKTPVILDGAWGTQMQTRGLPPGECADGWNLSHPDVVESVAREYVEAGSQIILT
ncbi:MAG: homocysteine S-methyltransferase family protein, partial [Candidatus Hinthialibacter sp.]